MRLSRVRKYKSTKGKNEISKVIKLNRKIKTALISCTLAGTALYSTSFVFADVGITDYIKKWYLERVTEVEEYLISSTETEATNQKAKLLREVRKNTEQSVKEIQKYAKDKQSSINQKLEEKTKDTIDAITFENQADVELTKQLIDSHTEADEIVIPEEDQAEEVQLEKKEKQETVVDPEATNN